MALTRDVGDFFSPFYNIKFYTAAETAPNLVVDSPIKSTFNELLLDQAYKADLKSDQSLLDSYQLEKYVSNLVIEAKMAAMLDFTLTLNPPIEVARDIIDKGLIKYDSVISIQWGYSGIGGVQVSNEYYMKLVKPSFEFGENVTFTLRGWEFYSHGLRISTNNKMFKREQYPTDYDVIYELITGMGCELNAEGINAFHSLYEAKTEPVIIYGNNWLTFKNLLRDNQLTFTTDEKKVIKLYQPENFIKEETAYNLIYYSQLYDSNDIPLISFGANSDQDLRAFLGGEHKSLFYTEIDTDSHEVKAVKLTGQTEPTNAIKGGLSDVNNATEPSVKQIIKVGNDTVIPYPGYGPVVHGSYMTFPSGSNNNDSKAEQHVKEASYQVNTKAKVVFPGVPDFMPFLNVNVFGVCNALDGTYLVESVRHEIGLSGYETSADLLKLSTSDSLSRGSRNLGPTIPNSLGASPDPTLDSDNTSIPG